MHVHLCKVLYSMAKLTIARRCVTEPDVAIWKVGKLVMPDNVGKLAIKCSISFEIKKMGRRQTGIIRKLSWRRSS